MNGADEVEEIKLNRLPDGTYRLVIGTDPDRTVKAGLSMAEVVAELETRTYATNKKRAI